jgi:hypothetical protein
VRVRPGRRVQERIAAHGLADLGNGSPERQSQAAQTTTWRLETLLETYGYVEVTAEAREAVEDSLRREGLGVDPPLTRAWPRTDVWVYPFSPEETETWAQREHATSRTAPSTAKPGLRGWHKAAILAVCGVLVLAGSLLVLDATGNLSAFLPEDRGGSVHGAGQPSRVEASFRDKYEEELRSQPEGARTKEVRCLIAGEDAYRCVAYTEAMGSGTYPDDFELAVDARGCWRAQPLAPNLIDATIAGCS